MKKAKKAFMGVVLSIALFLCCLTVALVPANKVQAATIEKGVYTIGKTVSGKITDESETYTYTFSLSKATLLELNYHADSKWGCGAYFQLFNKNGKSFSSFYSGDNESVTKSYYLEPGKYSVSLYTEDTCDVSCPVEYSFSFSNRGTQKETFTYANDFTSDVANKQIPFETTINGMLAYDEEYDYYRIYIPKSGTIQISITDGFGGRHFLEDASGYGPEIFVGSSGRGSLTYDVTKGTYYFSVWDDSLHKNNYQGAYSFKISYNKSSTKAFTLKKKSKTSMVVKASATGATSGYQIKYRPSSGKWKTVNVNGKKLNKTIKGLKKNKTYQVKIRTYYTYGGKKLYSSWGKTKTVKLK